MGDILTLAAPHVFQEEIRKSRFIAHAAPIEQVEAALAFFAAHVDPSASHHCWAYRLGQQYRFNDDGEPTGTAGRPILQAIDGQGLDGVAVVVIRWFGGIKLGAGGLMRAYGGCAAQCLRAADKLARVERVKVRCFGAYADLALLKARLQQAGAQLEDEVFEADGAWLSIAAPSQALAQLEAVAADVTRGRSRWQVQD